MELSQNEFLFSEPRRVGVWEENTQIQPKDLIIPNKESETEEEIPSIPDIDDLNDVLNKEVVKAPVVSTNKASLYQELDTELTKQKGFLLDDIDMTPLLNCLNLNEISKDIETIWTVETLCRDLLEDSQKEISK